MTRGLSHLLHSYYYIQTLSLLQTSLPLEETCDVLPLPYYLFTEELKFSDASSLCQAFGGELATPMSQEEQEVCGRERTFWCVFIFYVYNYVYILMNFVKRKIVYDKAKVCSRPLAQKRENR